MVRARNLILLSLTIVAFVACSWGQVVISVNFGPPVLPVYQQPFCPGPGYIWVPGYWAWGDDDYYWVPGTWALAPQPGFLWTPSYWGFSDGVYLWHAGYWGSQVGFYGGIDYGYGYPGNGYYGGYWRGRDFYYNRAVNNVNITNVRVYNRTVVNNVNVNRVAYNGGPGGVQARPTSVQLAAARESHIAATPPQVQHQQAARADRSQFASANHGSPAVMATPRPGAFTAPEATRGSLPAPHQSAQGQHPIPAGNQPAVHQSPQVQHPNNAGNQPAVHQPPQVNQPASGQNTRAHTAAPPSNPAGSRVPPQQNGQVHNLPQPGPAQRSAPPPPAQQARRPASEPRPPAPEQHSSPGRPVATPNMNQHPMSTPHQAAPPPRQAAPPPHQAAPPPPHQAAPREAPPKGGTEERPH